jgi:hypothetical protein
MSLDHLDTAARWRAIAADALAAAAKATDAEANRTLPNYRGWTQTSR